MFNTSNIGKMSFKKNSQRNNRALAGWTHQEEFPVDADPIRCSFPAAFARCNLEPLWSVTFFFVCAKTMLILSLSVMWWGAGAALSPDAFPFVRERLVNWTARAVDDIGGPASETRDTPLSSQCLTIPRRGRRAMIPSTEKQSVIYLNW